MTAPIRWRLRASALAVIVYLLFQCFSGAVPCALAETAVPNLTQAVTDLTGTLTRDQLQTLNQNLIQFSEQHGSQIAILIVPTTQPEEIEQYSIRVTDQWKLGRKGVDDGVLFLIAKNDHRMRIEVGRGLEGAIPDATAKRIISDAVTPFFKAGDFYGGVNAGLDWIKKAILGEQLPAPQPGGNRKSSGGAIPVFFNFLFFWRDHWIVV